MAAIARALRVAAFRPFGTVPVQLPNCTGPNCSKSINVLIGGIDLKTGGGSPIGAQQPPVPIKQIRSRIYWYPQGERN